jgi:serine/threonine protein phosphatase PrpC
MTPPLTLLVAGRTDVGSVRTNNEDNFGYDTRCGIFVVCDGMGGHAAGELASKIAVETILGYFRQDPGRRQGGLIGRVYEGVSERANALAGAVQLANQAIQQEAAQNSERAGMGSTIVAVLAEGNLFSVAHVGDSRVYLLRDGTIQLLTCDHSLVMEQVRRGLMTAEEAEKSEMQNVIVRSLGVEESVEPDLADHELAEGDVLLLCCDGLSRYVPESKMVEIIGQADTLEKACAELIEAAKTLGSDDNITCVLVRPVQQSRKDRILDVLIPARYRHRWQSSAA